MKSKDLPIGYWLIKADALLTQGINQIQTTTGLTRQEWQVLHAVQESKGIAMQELCSIMQPFGDDFAIKKIIQRFERENLVEQQQDKLYVTPQGQQLHQTALTLQTNFRARSMQNITEAEYQTTIATLQKLIANLED
ncbi:hypothetical protein HUW51_23220 [Adhaeribacter swui]|uniref:MarR family transcriptional regulator n=1 Tax=Adhaeribacter swui TaxID=2086471 RepID=A0A7G7GE92_9BACT|nr:hypothetical protein [Adhaeribacter swui]QNF35476.1 hypothetical protein HUW51_23220 [Adhaeribacter swui]